MFSAATAPLIAKVCAAVLVTSAAGAATYTVVEKEDNERVEATVPATEEAGDKPDGLAFENGDDEPVDKPAHVEEEAAKPSADENDEHETEEKQDAEDEKPGDTDPPDIEILHPEDGSHHDDKVIVFEGKTEPGSSVAAGPYPATVDDEGNWRIELVLSPGANAATISSTDEAGNIGYDKVTVWLDVEEKEEEKKEESDEKHDEEKDDVAAVGFSAKQQYGECDDENPYDVFWGTATPKSTVNITSPYGSGVAEVNKNGHWEIKVYFPNAPRGEVFDVTVTGVNGSKTFDFVAVEIANDEVDK